MYEVPVALLYFICSFWCNPCIIRDTLTALRLFLHSRYFPPSALNYKDLHSLHKTHYARVKQRVTPRFLLYFCRFSANKGGFKLVLFLTNLNILKMKSIALSAQSERMVREQDFLVSKTDLKGIIKYANQPFIEITGYTERELVGKNHNIIRHSDMPGGVFKLLWSVISVGNEFFGYIKNSSKDGSFYWILANVTPSFDTNSKIVGYYSVRRMPKRSALREVEKIYATMLEVERQYPNRKQGAQASMDYLLNFLAQHGANYEEFINTL